MIQMAKQRTRDRNMLIADLNNNLAKLSISVSFDGGMMYDKKFSCGISSQDTTQHRIFVFDVNIEDECPIGPTQLTINEVGELARSYMKSKGIDLTSDKFTMFVVSPLQQDVRKEGTTNPKYRAIVFEPKEETFIPGPSAANPCSLQRMPHVFFTKKVDVKAPMENKNGSSAAVNKSRIVQAVMGTKRYLRGSFILKDPNRPMPEYAALFEYSNVHALENFIDYIAKLTADNSGLLGQVSGDKLML